MERYNDWKVAYVITIKSEYKGNGIYGGAITYSDEQKEGKK